MYSVRLSARVCESTCGVNWGKLVVAAATVGPSSRSVFCSFYIVRKNTISFLVHETA